MPTNLKGQCHEIFDSGFFHKLGFPKHLNVPLGPVRFFSNILRDIRTPVANEKKLQVESFILLFCMDTFGYNVNIKINFFLQAHFKE